MFYIANLTEADYRKIDSMVRTSVPRNDFYLTFNDMNYDQRTAILNIVVWDKIKRFPMPKDEHNPKDPGLQLKNFYFSLGLLYLIEGYPEVKTKLSGREFKDKLDIYDNLYSRFKNHFYVK